MEERENLNADYLKGRKVCVTGRLVSMTHADLASVVRSCGGTFLQNPRRCGFTLVVGDHGWPSDTGGSINSIFDRTRQLKAYGYPIEFISEDEFLERLGFRQYADAIRGRHTLSDLSRILDISTVRLRRWMRVGLIQPVETQFQIPFFDFRQVAFVKQLHDLIEDGASLSNIRKSVDQAKNLLPQGQTLFEQLSTIELDGRVLFRLRDELVDQTGQTYFDFDGAGEDDATIFAPDMQSGVHDLCDEALALEEQGRLAEAADVYRRALQLTPDHPTLHFDLGNVLFRLDQSKQAINHFREAVGHCPDFAMAWHNLGSVYAHLGLWDEAEAALSRALSLVPAYADSHFTMAEVLRHQGRLLEAAKHQNASLEFSKADCLVAKREDLLRVVQIEDREERSHDEAMDPL